MTRRAIVMVTCLLLGASVVLCGAPELYIADEIFDFGVAVAGDRVAFTFVLENRGDEVLSIADIHTSCGCTTTTQSAMEITPGESVRLGGQLSTSGFAGSTVSKNVSFSTTDPARPRVTLKVSGRVVDEEPYYVDARDLAPGLMILIDVREYEDYIAGHLAGAISVHSVDRAILMEILPKAVPIVLYDQAGAEAPALAEQLLLSGFLDVRVLLGGLDEWGRRYGDRWVVDLPLTIGIAAP